MIDATSIKNPEDKNDLILYANEIGCKVVFSDEIGGLGVEYESSKQKKLIKEKLKELQGEN